MLPPFKEAVSKICTFLCFWRFLNPDGSSIEENFNTHVTTIPTCTNNVSPAIRNGGRQTVLVSREPVSGEPTKAARVFRLFSKRRNNKRIRKSPEDEDFVVREVPLLHNGHDNNGVSAGSNDGDVIVQVTIETAANHTTNEAKELIQEVA